MDINADVMQLQQQLATALKRAAQAEQHQQKWQKRYQEASQRANTLSQRYSTLAQHLAAIMHQAHQQDKSYGMAAHPVLVPIPECLEESAPADMAAGCSIPPEPLSCLTGRERHPSHQSWSSDQASGSGSGSYASSNDSGGSSGSPRTADLEEQYYRQYQHSDHGDCSLLEDACVVRLGGGSSSGGGGGPMFGRSYSRTPPVRSWEDLDGASKHCEEFLRLLELDADQEQLAHNSAPLTVMGAGISLVRWAINKTVEKSVELITGTTSSTTVVAASSITLVALGYMMSLSKRRRRVPSVPLPILGM